MISVCAIFGSRIVIFIEISDISIFGRGIGSYLSLWIVGIHCWRHPSPATRIPDVIGLLFLELSCSRHCLLVDVPASDDSDSGSDSNADVIYCTSTRPHHFPTLCYRCVSAANED